MAYVNVVAASGSESSDRLMTAVVFSATDAVALLVTVGVSLTLVTVSGPGLAVGVGAVRDLHGDVIDLVGIGNRWASRSSAR